MFNLFSFIAGDRGYKLLCVTSFTSFFFFLFWIQSWRISIIWCSSLPHSVPLSLFKVYSVQSCKSSAGCSKVAGFRWKDSSTSCFFCWLLWWAICLILRKRRKSQLLILQSYSFFRTFWQPHIKCISWLIKGCHVHISEIKCSKHMKLHWIKLGWTSTLIRQEFLISVFFCTECNILAFKQTKQAIFSIPQEALCQSQHAQSLKDVVWRV